MTGIVTKLREMVGTLEAEVEQEIDQRRQDFKYRLEKKRVVFEQGVEAQHRLLRMKLSKFLRESRLGTVLTAPFIYSLILPLSLLDVFITVYQQVCFRAYGIPRVDRAEYVVMDRKYLAYLNLIEKINCVYCEYGNGVLSYAREVASRTEQYWCPIKHSRKMLHPHERYYDFLEYGDAEGFRTKLGEEREKCRACEVQGSCGKKAVVKPPRLPE